MEIGRAAASQRARAPASEDHIAEQIVAAIMDRRLHPGAKLAENVLCDAFAVSRARIRSVFIKLAERGVVTLHPNRGAFVASPSANEARDVYQARRAVERSIAERAAAAITDEQIEMLRAHIAAEDAAGAAGNRREAIRLSGLFHMKLAEIAGNPVLTRFLEELVARTSLIIALFGAPRLSSCSRDEHGALLGALKARDGALAAELMERHLGHIEHELDIHEAIGEQADVREIFGV
jgi:DNA-binding GntR family transcriptional regulator